MTNMKLKELKSQTTAAIRIQIYWRAYNMRTNVAKKHERLLAKQNIAAYFVQKFMKGHIARTSMLQYLRKLRIKLNLTEVSDFLATHRDELEAEEEEREALLQSKSKSSVSTPNKGKKGANKLKAKPNQPVVYPAKYQPKKNIEVPVVAKDKVPIKTKNKTEVNKEVD
jgi:hypothetical protein